MQVGIHRRGNTLFVQQHYGILHSETSDQLRRQGQAIPDHQAWLERQCPEVLRELRGPSKSTKERASETSTDARQNEEVDVKNAEIRSGAP